MASKHFDLNIDKKLGGDNASNLHIPSQKAVKEYVDDTVATKTVVTFRIWEEEQVVLPPDVDPDPPIIKPETNLGEEKPTQTTIDDMEHRPWTEP